ncbi:MAG: hypothetical protein O2931_04960 [Planctomycetota bacterium]|nr:hypothetical protein [Planctomycetota bacterium]
MPDLPNTRFVVVPTATFSDHQRAAEALEVEIHHAWSEFAKQLAIEHRIPLSFSHGIPTEFFARQTSIAISKRSKMVLPVWFVDTL